MDRHYWPTLEWQHTDPINVGMDPKKLLELDAVIMSHYHNINGIIVVRQGNIVFERNYNGCGPDDPFHVTSVTKSILSALIGIAIDKGFINSADQKVLDFFPEYVANPADIQKKAITLRHLLTMTAPYSFKNGHEPLDLLCKQPNWVEYTLDQLGQNGKIGDFKYSSAGAHLLSAIISRTTGKSAREFANEFLFQPIGMKVIADYKMNGFGMEDLFGKHVKGWVKDPNGISTGGWGLTLTSRDMARFGFLFLNGGVWDDKQIISKSWIDKSTANNAGNFGYLWWLSYEDGVFAYLAAGDGGNMICCIPEKDLVIAIASKINMTSPDSWPLIKKYILPSVID